jgi:hypothetical protein
MSTYDYSKHIDQNLLDAEEARLAKVTARRDVAARRLNDAMAEHAAAAKAHRDALAGESDHDPFETQEALNAASAKVATAQEAVSAVEGAISAARTQHHSDRGRAYGPVVTVALTHLHEAAKRADAARAALAEAKAVWDAATKAIQSAVTNKAHVSLHPGLWASHNEIASADGSHVIPSAETMAQRLIHCKVH